MSRVTDTRSLVRQAWLELFGAHGCAPNDAAVKTWLTEKTGSARNSNTVSTELQAIRREAERRHFDAQVLPGLPPDFPEELVPIASQCFAELLNAGKAWAAAALSSHRAELEQHAAAAREQAAADVAGAQSALTQARAEVLALADRLSDRDRQIEAGALETSALRGRVRELDAALATEAGRVQAAQQRVVDLQASLEEAQREREASLERYRGDLARAEDRYAGFEHMMTARVAEEQAKVAALKNAMTKLEQRERAGHLARESLAMRVSELTGKLAETSNLVAAQRRDLEVRIGAAAVLDAKLAELRIPENRMTDALRFALDAGWKPEPQRRSQSHGEAAKKRPSTRKNGKKTTTRG
jgi:chromosome segregation ATPase